MNAGLPDIQGSITVYTVASDCFADGAFAKEDTSYAGESYHHMQNSPKFTFNASRSSSLYGSSDTVTPLSRTVGFFLKF